MAAHGRLRVLLEAWRERVHPDASGDQVAVAFTLMGGGAVLAILGVLLVMASDLAFGRAAFLRELGIIAAALGLPAFLLGIVAGLPALSWVRALSLCGLALVAVSVVFFSWWYPDRWHVTIQAPNGVAVGGYLMGTALMAASAVGGVAQHLIERATAGKVRDPMDPWSEPDHAVSREEIEADIAWSGKQGWSWGGTRHAKTDVTLTFKDEPGVEFSGMGPRAILMGTPSSAPDVTAANALGNLRGTKRDEEGDVPTSQVQYLKQLKAQKAAAEAERRSTWWWKLSHPRAWLRSRG